MNRPMMDGSVDRGVDPGVDRVRAWTDPDVLADLDQQMVNRLRRLADEGPEAISNRLRRLDEESDIERVLEVNASVVAMLGLGLGILRGRRWLILPLLVLSFLLQHAIQGWCPPLPLLRRMGFRTRAEIDAERTALKYLRGDFDADPVPKSSDAAERALAAVRR